MKPFDKPYRPLEDLLELLARRGMKIPSRERAVTALRHINYYRLRAYWLPFESNTVDHQFQHGTDFDRVLDVYQFDGELRMSTMKVLERIEVSIRAQIAREYSQAFGSHGHENAEAAYSKEHWTKAMNMLQTDLSKSKDTFVAHFRHRYSNATPPIWALVEVLSFGSLSYWFAKVLPRAVQYRVGDIYGTHPDILSGWLHHISVLRNIVAHHGRLWNRVVPFQPRIPKPQRHSIGVSMNPSTNRLYNTLTILQYLNTIVSPSKEWGEELCLLFHQRNIDSRMMGFPHDWYQRPVWRGLVRKE